MPLTDIEVKKIKCAREDGKPRRHYDANGMYLEVLATGAKYKSKDVCSITAY